MLKSKYSPQICKFNSSIISENFSIVISSNMFSVLLYNKQKSFCFSIILSRVFLIPFLLSCNQFNLSLSFSLTVYPRIFVHCYHFEFLAILLSFLLFIFVFKLCFCISICFLDSVQILAQVPAFNYFVYNPRNGIAQSYVNQEFCDQENYPSKMKQKLKHYQINKSEKKIVVSRPPLQEILKGVLQAKGKVKSK